MTTVAARDASPHAIAIIGMAGRFPRARDVAEFWRNIRDGVECISRLSDEELRESGVDQAVLAYPGYVRAKGVLDEVDLFDAGFFGYTPDEARAMDPQQRLFLECAWTAIEDAGYAADRSAGAVGVFAGTSLNTYLLHNLASHPEIFKFVGADKDYLSTRVSYKLNLTGPSMVVQTACSTSLVAITQACQALLTYQCDVALAGGVCVLVPQKAGYFHTDGSILSPDGTCRAFDANARGTVPGSGAGVVVLKRLAEAIGDGDLIQAVIRGFAVNNDGAAKMGYTAPSAEGQAQVILMAHALAGVSADSITYVEAHGTGTDLGDPIEIAALTEAFHASTANRAFCAIGSVKTNVGHLDTAAGVASVIKTALALRHRSVPPSLHFDRPNPKIDFEKSPFYVNTRLKEWPEGPTPRRAGVSSFGLGGTNAHLVLEEAPPRERSSESREWQILVLSARTSSELDCTAANLADHLESHGEDTLADVAYTLAVGRKRFPVRAVVVCRSRDEAICALRACGDRRTSEAIDGQREGGLALTLPVSGWADASFAADLFAREEVFRRAATECAARFTPVLGLDIGERIRRSQTMDDVRPTDRARVAEAVLFTAEYACARLWMSWGVRPRALVGAGIGDCVAACLAGAIDLAQAVELAVARGRLLEAAGGGSQQAADTERDALAAVVRRCTFVRPAILLLSSATGSRVQEGDLADPSYWAGDSVEPDGLSSVTRELARLGTRILLEAGPGRILAERLRRDLSSIGAAGEVAVLSSLPEGAQNESAGEWVARTLASLWLHGATLDWRAYFAGERRWRVSLPTYPFNRRRYWLSPTSERAPSAVGSDSKSDARGVDDWLYTPVWSRAFPQLGAPDRQAGRRWLVFADDRGTAGRVIERLRRRREPVTVVLSGGSFERLGPDEYRIRTTVREDCQALVRALRDAGSIPTSILHMWGTGGDPVDLVAPIDVDHEHSLGFWSVLRFVQSLLEADGRSHIDLSVVTSGVHDVLGSEPLSPAKSSVVGLCRVIPQEHPALSCRHLDLDPARLDESTFGESDVDMLIEDAGSASAEPMIAYRNGSRWMRRCRPLRLDGSPGHSERLRPEGVYVLTGGLGDIGLSLAEYLAGAVKARLVLTGLSPFPPEAAWDAHRRTYGDGDRTSRRIQRLQRIQALGSRLLVCQADVADLQRMRGVFDETERAFGGVNGVIHAAGLVSGDGFRPVVETNEDTCARHFAAKVHGLRVLDELVRDRPLDFMLLISSLSSLLGGLGFAAYASANAFMDAFGARRQRTSAFPWLTINLDGWASRANEARVGDPRTLLARPVMREAEGVEVVRRILRADSASQVLVSVADLPARLAQQDRRATAGAADASDASSQTVHARPKLQTEFETPRTSLENVIAGVWSDVLGLDRVGVNDSFFELGGDSVLGLQMIARLKHRLAVDFPAVALYEAPTVSSLARLVETKRQDGGAPPPEPVRRPDEEATNGRGVVSPAEPAKARMSSDVDTLEQHASTSAPASNGQGDHAIAIVGMTGRFPGAPTLDAFWRNLQAGAEARTIFSDDELRAAGVPSATLSHPNFVRSGFVLDGIDRFDAAFFGINPREAELLDPQHRLFLECSWEALEHAGYDPDTFPGSIGVFGGAALGGYLTSNVYRNPALVQSVGGRQAVFGSVPDYMVTRVAYKLNLKGPAYSVQTACSTSLVAVRIGCQSLLNRECDMALAGGVSVAVPHRTGYVYEEGGIMSPDGVCRAFDARAGGTVFGSGVGIVVLKRLADALVDRDTIHAVIRGAATNNDGALKVGFTAPSVVGQARVIEDALAAAGVPPDSITYVEAHGTGTELGDPIEVAALTRAYRSNGARRHTCAIGSVKPNIGHLDAAAGVSSLIKTILALQHRQLPPAINFERPNPAIDFDESPFFVNTTLEPWVANGTPRRAGVSSFGFGGTNAHVILEEAPADGRAAPSRTHQLLLLAARTEKGVEMAASQLRDHLERQTDAVLPDVAYTLAVGRRHFAHRRAVVCAGREDAIECLNSRDGRRVFTSVTASKTRQVVFMFPGQGSQYVGMGAGLYREEPLFRRIVDECAEDLRQPLGCDLLELLVDAHAAEGAAERLKQTSLAQAALFVVEYALARLWMSWGIAPAGMIGHSVGELVAACLAGVFTRDEALGLVAARGRLMHDMPRGAMAAVPLAPERVVRMLEPDLWLAAVNAPTLCTVAGTVEAIDRFLDAQSREGVDCARLRTSHAFHSGLMEGAVPAFSEAVRRVARRPPAIPFLSNVTGMWITDAEAQDPEYWGRHIRQPVRFADGVRELLTTPDRLLLEVGPGNTLSALVRQQTSSAGHRIVSSLRHPNEQASDVATMLAAVGRLWVSGAPISWPRYYAAEQRRRVPLPTYPFERERHWVDPEAFSWKRTLQSLGQVSSENVSDWFHVASWRRSIAPRPSTIDSVGRDESCLVFESGSVAAERIVQRLVSRGQRLLRVTVGDGYERVGSDRWTLNPASRSDYLALFRDLREDGRLPGRLVHLWGLTGHAEPGPSDAAVEERLHYGFYSLLNVVQALADLGVTSAMRLAVLTDGVHEVTGDETLVPEKATVLGPCRVVPQEFPSITCQHFDLAIDETPALDDDQADVLIADVLGDSREPAVAYRRGRRWVLTYAGARLEPLTGDSDSRLRDRGVYVITGGTGGIGLVLAGYLAEACRARLILTGRHGLPPRDQWPGVVSALSADDPTSRRIHAVEKLERLGAEVLVFEADVTDLARMRDVVSLVRARFGRIDGVIHAAGIAGGGMIQLKKSEAAAAVLAPKVQGARVLARLFHDQPVDFMVLCSSLTALVGGIGQVDYCGANAYLDAFARQYALETGTFTVAVNWNTWREVGMAVDTAVPEDLRDALRRSRLTSGMTNRDGVDAFRRILARCTERQIAISPANLGLQLEAAMLDDGPATSSSVGERFGVTEGAAAASHPRPTLPSPYVAPGTETEQRICAIWQESLGIDRVGVDDNFFDLGGHSLLAIQVMGRANRALGADVPVARLYDGLTVRFIAGLIDRLDIQPAIEADADLLERRRDKARRQREHQQRRRVVMGR